MSVKVDDVVVVVSCCQNSGQSINRRDARSGCCEDGGVDVMVKCRCMCRRLLLLMLL